ncbi:MAG TPA: SIMPL domain-containing protein [Pyrinomonadaceae bacterium]|nr:SIMPL domain-containing protein [Pyrinomonadaceae bacterium]
MKLLFTAAAVLCSLTINSHTQNKPEPRVIEVSGSAERLITPDEFTFKITLLERIEKKEKLMIEQQEVSLRDELTKLGVDVAKDLSIYDISSSYFRQKKIKDVLGTKDYRLKIRDLKKISQLQEIADRLNIAKLDLIDTEHSEMTRLRRETKMDAIKAAKEKASYLLGAIGERVGKPVYVKEVEEETPRYISGGVMSNSNSNNTLAYSRGTAADNESDLSFSQIKIRYVIQARFEIE